MKLYLVNGKVTKTEYMGTPKQGYEDRIVWAHSDKEARDKFVHHFDEKSEPYSVSYYAEVVSVNEAIA